MEALESALNGAMSNVLKVSKQTTISELHAKGWSLRRIALELGLNRRTVAAYANRAQKPGCDSSSNFTTEVTGGPPTERPASKAVEVLPKSSPVPSRKSLCCDHEAFILNPAVEKRKWRRSPRCQGRQAGILEFGLDKFLKNPQQDEFPALWVGQLLRSSDQTL